MAAKRGGPIEGERADAAREKPALALAQIASDSKTQEMASSQIAVVRARRAAEQDANADFSVMAEMTTLLRRGTSRKLTVAQACRVRTLATRVDLKALRVSEGTRDFSANELKNPLGWAAAGLHQHMLRFLAERCDLEAKKGSHGRTPLLSAAAAGKLDSLNTLLALGADPGATDERGETALMLCVQRAGMFSPSGKECFDALLPVSNALARNAKGQTALMMAAAEENDHFFEKLLPSSDASAIGENGETAMTACLRQIRDEDFSTEMVFPRLKELAKKASGEAWASKAKTNLGHWHGPLDIAVQAGEEGVAHWMLDQKLDSEDCGNALTLWVFAGYQERYPDPLPLARRLVERTRDLGARWALPAIGQSIENVWAGGCASALEVLNHRLDASEPNDPDRCWALADLIASADPSQRCAKEIWEYGGPERLPRLAARVEEEILRQVVAQASQKGSVAQEGALERPMAGAATDARRSATAAVGLMNARDRGVRAATRRL